MPGLSPSGSKLGSWGLLGPPDKEWVAAEALGLTRAVPTSTEMESVIMWPAMPFVPGTAAVPLGSVSLKLTGCQLSGLYPWFIWGVWFVCF